MSGDNLYLLSALPTLGELGSTPPMPLARLLEQVIEGGENRPLLEALLLSDDLLQRQAFLSGELDEVEPAVLTSHQARDEEPLPEYLVSSEDTASQPAPDDLWALYYRYATNTATENGNSFLSEWVEYEVGLRNALVKARAKALNIDPQEYLVVPDIGSDKEDFSKVISEWTAASDPFAGLRILDEARWKWLGENDGWFTFENDELVAYGAKLMLLQRWQRLSREVPAQTEKAMAN